MRLTCRFQKSHEPNTREPNVCKALGHIRNTRSQLYPQTPSLTVTIYIHILKALRGPVVHIPVSVSLTQYFLNLLGRRDLLRFVFEDSWGFSVALLTSISSAPLLGQKARVAFPCHPRDLLWSQSCQLKG